MGYLPEDELRLSEVCKCSLCNSHILYFKNGNQQICLVCKKVLKHLQTFEDRSEYSEFFAKVFWHEIESHINAKNPITSNILIKLHKQVNKEWEITSGLN